MRRCQIKVLLVLSHNIDRLERIRSLLREDFGFERIVVAKSRTALHNIISTFAFDEHEDMIICDEVSITWIPDNNYYQLFWNESGDKIVGILRGSEKWTKK